MPANPPKILIRFLSRIAMVILVFVACTATAATFQVVNANDNGPGSLRQAISAANNASGDDTISFAIPEAGPHVIELFSALPTLTTNIELINDRPADQPLTVQRSAAIEPTKFPVFITGPGSTVLIAGITIRNGNVAGAFPIDAGGGIRNDHGTLTLRSCILSGNSATSGGAVENDGSGGAAVASLTLDNCVLSENSASSVGGGIANHGNAVAVLTRCTLSGNKGPIGGGAIYNDGQNGGNGSVTLNSCTLNANSASGGVGGAIFSQSSSNGNATVNLSNCTLSGNTCNSSGGAIFSNRSQSAATVSLKNCTLSANSSAQNHDAIYNGGTLEVGNDVLQRAPNGQNIRNVGGQVTSLGHNLSDDAAGGDSATGPGGFLKGPGDIRNTNPQLAPLASNGGPTQTHALFLTSPGINAGDDAYAPILDQRGYPRLGVSDIGSFEFTPGLVANVATRLPVGMDDNALFQGFTVQGPAGSTKKIVVRALGPFLAAFNISDFLANPILDIFQGNNRVATNDDWSTTQIGGLITSDQSQELAASGLAPGNEKESAIIANLAPGSYTAVVRGSGNTVGIGLVDAYDLSTTSPAKVVNVATRGLVQPGDRLLTAGFIIQNGPVRAVIRAIGPSLTAFNISNALPDTTLQLRDQNGAVVQENDDWETDQKQELESTGLQPSNPKEAALVRTIQPGQYTAQVRGKPEGTGIGVVEVYFIQ
jgi:hypothetical protein